MQIFTWNGIYRRVAVRGNAVRLALPLLFCAALSTLQATMKPPPPVFAAHCVKDRWFLVAPSHRPHDRTFDREELRAVDFGALDINTTADGHRRFLPAQPAELFHRDRDTPIADVEGTERTS